MRSGRPTIAEVAGSHFNSREAGDGPGWGSGPWTPALGGWLPIPAQGSANFEGTMQLHVE